MATQSVEDTLDSDNEEIVEHSPPSLPHLEHHVTRTIGEKEGSSSIYNMETQNILNGEDDGSWLTAETQPVENSVAGSKSVPSICRVDTNKLDALLAGQKSSENEENSSIFNLETQNILPDSCDDSNSSLLMAETQPLGIPVAGASHLRNMLSDSEIIGASTQYLLSKMSDTEDVASDIQDSFSDIDPNSSIDDDLSFAADTQPVFNRTTSPFNSTKGSENEKEDVPIEEADTFIVPGSDEEENENGEKNTVVKWYEKLGENPETAGSGSSSESDYRSYDPKSGENDRAEKSSSVLSHLCATRLDEQNLDGTVTNSISMVEASQPSTNSRTATLGRNITDVNCKTMDETAALESDILIADNNSFESSSVHSTDLTRAATDVTESKGAGNTSPVLQLDSTLEKHSENSVPQITKVKDGGLGSKIKVNRRSSPSVFKAVENYSKESTPSPISRITKEEKQGKVSEEDEIDDENTLPSTQELTIEDEKLNSCFDDEDFIQKDEEDNSISRDEVVVRVEEDEYPDICFNNEDFIQKDEEKTKGLSIDEGKVSVEEDAISFPVHQPVSNTREVKTKDGVDRSQTEKKKVSPDLSGSKESRKSRAKKVFNLNEWIVQKKRKPVPANDRRDSTPDSKKRSEAINDVIQSLSSPNSKLTVTAAEALESMLKNKEGESNSHVRVSKRVADRLNKENNQNKTIPSDHQSGKKRKSANAQRNAKSASKALPEETSTTEVVQSVPKRGRGRPRKDPASSTQAEPKSFTSRGNKRLADSSPERPGTSKRRAVEGSGSGGRNRSREVDGSSESCSSPTLRNVKMKKMFRVMFTGYQATRPDTDLITELRGSVTESVTECNVLVTDKIKRTAKFLSMIARGVPIVSPAWLSESKKYFRWMEPWDFILNDTENEKKWGFKLSETLKKAQAGGLFKGNCDPEFVLSNSFALFTGLRIHVTDSVQPSPKMCKDIIECSGGVFVEDLPGTASSDLYIVSCDEDKKLTESLARAGVPVMNKEWLLSGLLKYKLNRKFKL